MQILPALTKPRFSFLHAVCLAILVLTFFAASVVMNIGPAFKDGLHQRWSNTAGVKYPVKSGDHSPSTAARKPPTVDAVNR